MKTLTGQFRSLIVVLGLCSACDAENWPQWRGPRGTGVSRERNVPVFWGEDRAVAWKCALPRWGSSTPAVWGNAVYVTTHSDLGELQLLRIDKQRGQVVWKKNVGVAKTPRGNPKRQRQNFHRLHNLASPSPVTNGEQIVVHFGNGDLAAFDAGGQQLWKRNLQVDYGQYTIWWGHANSPVLVGDLVISACMQDSLADQQQQPVESYVVAHDLRTGQVRWRTLRRTGATSEQCDSYTTPLLISQNGDDHLVVMGGNQLDAYDPKTGRRLWKMDGLIGGRTVTGPTFSDGVLYTTRGMRGSLLAVKLSGAGSATRRDVVWRQRQGTPDTCCPVVWGDLLFTVTDEGIVRCYDVKNGRLRWKNRLPGQYKASPVAADGRIYFINTDGLCSVVSATTRFDKLTENQLNDQVLASPVISDGLILIRGSKTLYAIGRR